MIINDKSRVISDAISRFMKWLEKYGEISYDHQTFFAGRVGKHAKSFYYKNPILGTISVAPIIFCEAYMPMLRPMFHYKQRFPIADAHYAMGYALLAKITDEKLYYRKAVHFLEELIKSRSLGYQHYCWGYPFDWVTRNGTLPANTPFITTLPYVYEAFDYVYRIDKNEKWIEVMHSIAEHARLEIKDIEISPGKHSCGYGPYDDKGCVVNASAYRAFLLTSASIMFSDDRYMKIAEGNINFVLSAQQLDGSWPYAVEDTRDFVDHFHTCFVLKALTKIEKLTGNEECRKAIEKGVNYYITRLFDEQGLPKPFSKAPRMTVYRNELYDYAECINLGVLLKGRFPELDKRVGSTIEDLLQRWQKPDGSFRSRKLLIGWDNVPMHRWAQSQIFRGLCFLLHEENKK